MNTSCIFRLGNSRRMTPSGRSRSTDVVGYMVSNPIDRSSFDDRSNLAKNADGSIDIYLQQKAPTGHEQNWLPTPAGKFKLMLRAYLPGAAILDGTYRVPPVVQGAVR